MDARPERAAPGRYRLPRLSRIRRTNEIRDLLRRGKRRKTPHLDVFSEASPVSLPRIALVVPRYGHTIVERNRLRRRLREVARHELMPRLREASRLTDVLLRARAAAYDAKIPELRAEIRDLGTELCSGEPLSD